MHREFSAEGPNQRWVMDLTYVPTWAGMVYVCFITDVFSRMIVGWRVATTMRTEMVFDALEMARWQRGTNLEGLVTHSDAGSVRLCHSLLRTALNDAVEAGVLAVNPMHAVKRPKIPRPEPKYLTLAEVRRDRCPPDVAVGTSPRRCARTPLVEYQFHDR